MKKRGESLPERPTAPSPGASKGIGFAQAKQFTQGGHDLVLVTRTGYRAIVAEKRVVVPGLLNKAFVRLGELPPRAVAQTGFTFLWRGQGPNKARWEVLP